jgi:threonine/homoserine/homoserine lactone efflux protein
LNPTLIFFIGLFVAMLGVIPPGLLNMTAAKISLRDGHTSGFIFSIGVCFTVMLQTALAVIFASYLSNHPGVVGILQQVAFVVFILLAIYFLFVAKSNPKISNKVSSKSKRNRLFYGMGLAAVNVLPIPYQAYMSITLASAKLMDFEKLSVASYVTGAVMGTFVMLYLYILFFNRIKGRALTTQKSMNISIGVISLIVAIVTLFNIIKKL